MPPEREVRVAKFRALIVDVRWAPNCAQKLPPPPIVSRRFVEPRERKRAKIVKHADARAPTTPAVRRRCRRATGAQANRQFSSSSAKRKMQVLASVAQKRERRRFRSPVALAFVNQPPQCFFYRLAVHTTAVASSARTQQVFRAVAIFNLARRSRRATRPFAPFDDENRKQPRGRRRSAVDSECKARRQIRLFTVARRAKVVNRRR